MRKILAVAAIFSVSYLAVAYGPYLVHDKSEYGTAYLKLVRRLMELDTGVSAEKHLGLGFGTAAGCNTQLLQHVYASCVHLRIDDDIFKRVPLSRLLELVISACQAGLVAREDDEVKSLRTELCEGGKPYVSIRVDVYRRQHVNYSDGSYGSRAYRYPINLVVFRSKGEMSHGWILSND